MEKETPPGRPRRGFAERPDGVNAPEESTLELRRALPLPAAAPHDVEQQRDASEDDERERLHSHGDFLIGPKGVNL